MSQEKYTAVFASSTGFTRVYICTIDWVWRLGLRMLRDGNNEDEIIPPELADRMVEDLLAWQHMVESMTNPLKKVDYGKSNE